MDINRNLLVQHFTSILVGVATWLAFLWIGLENAAIWGIAAGVFNSIFYLGPVVVTGGTALVALLQFGTIDIALAVGGISLGITSLEGYLLTPWLTGRASRMTRLQNDACCAGGTPARTGSSGCPPFLVS